LIDRVLRSGVGVAMIYVGFINQGLVADNVARLVLGGMGVFMLGVVLIGFCPMYTVIGFSTASPKAGSAR
jgi:hypothetical protein